MHRALVLLALVAIALGACRAEPAPDPAEVDEDFARFDGAEVQRHFKALAGVDLDLDTTSSAGPDGTEELKLGLGRSGASFPVSMRYGTLTIYVAKNEPALEELVALADREGDERAVTGNVVLSAIGSGTPEDAQAFRRSARILTSLGTPPQEVRLAPEDTPCERAGIDPGGAGDREGTCRLGQQTLTVANAGGPLRTPGKSYSDVRVQTGTAIVNRRFGRRQVNRAQGGFVVVTLRVENTGDEPDYPRDPTLVVDGKRYSPDPSKQTYLPVLNPATIQPGTSERFAFLYDIPAPAAGRGGQTGVLEVSADANELTGDFATALGRIRLPGRLPAPRGSIS